METKNFCKYFLIFLSGSLSTPMRWRKALRKAIIYKYISFQWIPNDVKIIGDMGIITNLSFLILFIAILIFA